MKKIISLIIVFCLSVTVFSGCKNEKTYISAFADGDNVLNYSITRSASATSVTETAAKNLRSALKKAYNCNIVILKDTLDDYDENYEILVGNTSRKESTDAIQKLKDNRPNNNTDFIIKAVGTKIVIAATTDTMTSLACEWFAKTFKTLEDLNGMPSDYEFIYAPENNSIVNTVAGNNLGNYSVVTPKQWVYLCGRQVNLFTDYMLKSGYTVTTKTDNEEVSPLEIIAGDTDREESKSVSVDGDNYIIKVTNGKVVIKGGSDLATYRALADFLEMIKTANDENKPLELAEGTEITGEYSKDKKGTYTLNFNDDFNGTNLNYKIWSCYGTETADNSKYASSCLGGTVFSSAITNKEHVKVENGLLNLTTKKVSDTDFRGACASTCYSMIYRYGFWEVRCKLPEPPATVSLWTNAAFLSSVKPAVGDMSRCAFTEIDLIETFGSNTTFASNIHRWGYTLDAAGNTTGQFHTSLDGDSGYNATGNDRRYTYKNGDETLSDGFHIYSYYADGDVNEFAFDGKKYCSYDFADSKDGTSFLCLQNYLIMYTKMGDASYGAKWHQGDTESTTFQVDYTRIYQTDAVNSQMRYGDGFNEDGNYQTSLSYVYPENKYTY